MRTTITIDDAQLKELMSGEPGASVSEAVRRAIEEKVRRRRIEKFLGLAGSAPDMEDWRVAEDREVAQEKRRSR
jgi:hypothetical protein